MPFEAFHAYYTDHCAIKTAPYPGMVEVLRKLKQEGFHTAVVSNKNDEAVKILMEQHFPGLVDSSMGVKDGIRKKPAPDSVLEVMRELGATKEDAVYIGDSEVDKATADNSGLNCISVTWGFRDRDLLESRILISWWMMRRSCIERWCKDIIEPVNIIIHGGIYRCFLF